MHFTLLVLNALSFWLGWTALAYADPITTALFGAAFASSFLGGVVSLGITFALQFGASLLINQLAGTPEQPKQTFGMQLSLQVGGDNPIAFPVGWTATAGQLVYPGTWGHDGDTPNAYAVWEILLSDLPTPDKPAIWVNEQKCMIDWNVAPTTQGYPVTEFRIDGKDHLWVQFDDGTQITPSSYLRAKFAGHETRPYTANMVGVGQAKVRVTALADREVWSGAPSFVFETFGTPLYNIAKDSSAGGSGTHRWDDPSTWEPSSNPVVQAYNIRRGIFYYPTPNSRADAQWIYGGNNKKPLSAYRLPASNWIAAINACDTLINLDGGGTEKQFRAGAMISGDMQPIEVINQLLASCNARMAEVGGIYKVQVGAPGAAVYAFTDEHIIITDGQSFDPFPGVEDTHNAIEATYPEPGEKWGTKDAPGRYNEDWEAEDGGRQLVAEATYPMVPYKYQVQRLMLAAIKDARRFRNHGFSLPPDAWALEPNDVVAWTSPRNGYENKKFLITSILGKRGYNQVVGLKEIDPSDHDWNPATDQIPVTIGDLVIERPPPQLMTGWQALPADLVDNEDNSRRPSIEVRYTGGLTDVRAVRVQVRLAGATGLTYDVEQPYDPAETEPARILNGVFLPVTGYEVRGKFRPYSGRVTLWSNQDIDGTEGPWLAVTTNDARFTGDDLAPGSIFLTNLTEQVQNAINDVIFNLPGSVSAQMENLRELFELAMASMSDLAVSNDQRVQSLEVRVGNALASISHEEQVRISDKDAAAASLDIVQAQFNGSIAEISTLLTAMASDVEAHATSITQLGVQVGDATANGMLKWELQTGLNGAAASLQMLVRASNSTGYGAAGFLANVYADLTSEVITIADKWIVTNGGLTSFAQAMKWESGELLVDQLKVRLITSPDGTSMVLDAVAPELTFIGS